jgi:hypothetical protein
LTIQIVNISLFWIRRCVHFPFFVKFCYISIILIVNRCVCIILVFVNKQAFWRWRFPRRKHMENQNKIHQPRTLSCQYQHFRDLFIKIEMFDLHAISILPQTSFLAMAISKYGHWRVGASQDWQAPKFIYCNRRIQNNDIFTIWIVNKYIC